MKEGWGLLSIWTFFLSARFPVMVKQACICRAYSSKKDTALAHFEKLSDSWMTMVIRDEFEYQNKQKMPDFATKVSMFTMMGLFYII